MKACAYTGHRPEKLPFGNDENDPRCKMLKQKIMCETLELIRNGVTTFIVGMARGVDKEIGKLGQELDNAQKTASSRYFRNTSKAIEEMRNGTIDATEAFDAYNKEADAAAEANEQYQKANKKMAAGLQVTAEEIDVLASYLGIVDPNILLANWDMVGPMIASVQAEGEDAFHRLNEAAFITITGTSVADFSALTNGLISVENLAADAVEALIATGQWTTETITLPQEGAQWDPISGSWTTTTLNTNQTVLRYTGSNPLRSAGRSSGSNSSGGGGSGGSGRGGGSRSSNTEVSQNIQKIQEGYA